jgi:hypothetical protein
MMLRSLWAVSCAHVCHLSPRFGDKYAMNLNMDRGKL